MAQTVLESARLRLCRFDAEDDGGAALMLQLFVDPDFITHIGDRGVRTLEQARQAMRDGPIATEAEHGYAMWRVQLREDGQDIGMCGLVRRPRLDGPDLGYAFLPGFRGQGYAREAAAAVLAHARDILCLPRLQAIVSPANTASIRLLQGLGFALAGPVTMAEDAPPIHLFRITF